MPRIRIDDSQFPLVVTEWPEGAVTDPELEEWLAASVALWERGPQLALHVGMRATGLTSVQRKRMGEFSKLHARRLAEVVIATAIVSDSPLVRGIVTAINWVAPPPFPQRTFARRTEATQWLHEQRASASRARTG